MRPSKAWRSFSPLSSLVAASEHCEYRCLELQRRCARACRLARLEPLRQDLRELAQHRRQSARRQLEQPRAQEQRDRVVRPLTPLAQPRQRRRETTGAQPSMKRRQLSSQRLGPSLGNERDRRGECDPRLQGVGELRERRRPRTFPRAPTSLATAQVKCDRRICPGERGNHSKHWHPRERPRQRTKNKRPHDA